MTRADAEAIAMRFLLRSIDERRGERDLPLLSVSADRGVIPRTELTGDEPRADDLSKYKLCQPGDVVVNRMSAYQGALGVTSRVGIVSPDYLVLRPASAVSPRWLHHLMRSRWFVSEMASRVRGIGSIGTGNVRTPRVSSEDIGQIVVPLPHMTAQQTVAEFLDTETARIDALITKKRRTIHLLGHRGRQRARDAVTLGRGYSDPIAVSAREALPSGVRPLKASWIAQFGSGTTPESGNEMYYGGGIPWVLTGDLDDSDLEHTTRTVTDRALQDYSALKVHPAGSLVVAMYGATIGRLGVLRVAAAVNQACCVITPGSDLEPGFLFYYLMAFRSEVIDLGRGSGQPNISQEILRALRLPIPPRSVQRKIVAELNSAGQLRGSTVQRLIHQIELLEEHRQALITAAVTGNLDLEAAA